MHPPRDTHSLHALALFGGLFLLALVRVGYLTLVEHESYLAQSRGPRELSVHNDAVKQLMNKIEYIAKNKFVSRPVICGHKGVSPINTRFSHHLSCHLRSKNTVSTGAAAFFGGLTMMGIS